MSDLTPEQNERLREAMEAVIEERFDGKRSRLAEAMGRARPSLSDFLNRKGGASMETAEIFAQRVAKKPVGDIIGNRRVATVSHIGQGAAIRAKTFVPDAQTERKARVLLQQPPQSFSDEAIDIAKESTRFETEAEAKNPAAVAEGWRLAILGTAATFPPNSSERPGPAGTRRSRSRE